MRLMHFDAVAFDITALELGCGFCASRQLLLAALVRWFDVLVSVPLMLEYEAVLTRQEHLAAAGITAEELAIVRDALAVVIESVRLSFLWRPRLKDAADEMVLETAVKL
jgi:hypothetical protein